MSDPADGLFDRALRRLRRNRAAALQARGAEDLVRGHMVAELLDRLALVQRRFTDALDLGCADGALTRALRARGLDVVAADASPAFAAAAGGTACDEDRLPFEPGSFDLVMSAGVLDTVNDLPGALVQVRRALRPDGLFLTSFIGAGSLVHLKAAMRAGDDAEGAAASPHVHPQIEVRAAGDLLVRAGFALPVADTTRLIVRYSRFARLVADLRAAGGTNLLQARARRPLGRLGLAAATAAFESAAGADGKTDERFEIIHLSGWAPAPDQPRPARRGSATASLAEALRPPRKS